MSRKRYPGSDSFRRALVGQIAGEIDRTPAKTLKLLRKMGFLGLRPRRPRGHNVTYDTRSLEVLKSMLGIPHRHISDFADDWLNQWIQGEHDDTN